MRIGACFCILQKQNSNRRNDGPNRPRALPVTNSMVPQQRRPPSGVAIDRLSIEAGILHTQDRRGHQARLASYYSTSV